MQKLTIADLNKIYDDAEAADKEVFAEQRSNVLLIAGEHYTKRNPQYSQRVRDDKTLSENQKLRLTKNHIHKVHRHYTNQILTFSPGVAIIPQKDSEVQDQKDAELNKAVWEDAKYKYRLKEKTREWAGDYTGLGEVAVKIFWDPNAGDFLGYQAKPMLDENGEQVVDEFGNPVDEKDENGQLVADESTPLFSGDFIFERIFGFNLLIHAGSINMRDAEVWCIRKMANSSDLEEKYKNDPDKLKMVKDVKDEAFIVFDATKANYERAKSQTLIKEFYWKPCYKYPNGYFAISTSSGILEEGELPYGVWPIVWQGFDEHPTSRRARSIIKVARPFQAEINRASSAVATHQVTIGDDKIIYQAGTKLSPGSLLPGVRGITYQGAEPTVMAGRDGSQYLPYIQSQISEMYEVLMMEEENMEKENGQLDPYAMLFKSMRQQKKYSGYGEKFNQFLVDLCELYLSLAKHYLPDDRVIYAVGKQEQVNLSEFRKTTKLCYQIKVEEQDETIESKLGKQLTMNNILQYVGKQLKPEDVGKIVRAMPFGNMNEAFDDLTLNHDNAKNDMLALERGEMPVPNGYDDHIYIVNKLTHRMRQADFKFLDPMVQQNYDTYKNQHEQMEAEKQKALLAAKNETVPTDGALIACDLYIPDPSDPTKASKRVRIPYGALNWLVETLESQGRSLETLETMNQGALAEMSRMLIQQQGAAPTGMSPPSGMMGVGGGQASPVGVS